MNNKKVRIFLLIFLCLIIGLHTLAQKLVMEDSELKKVDLIIVLGYPANKDGTPSDVMISRVDKGLELLRSNYSSHILFTGDGNSNESQVMSDYAKQKGTPEDLILQEPNAQNTKQNAEYSVQFMLAHNWESAIVVTSPYHMRRTAIIFQKYDLDFSFVKAQLPEDLSLLVQIRDIFHEAISFIGGAY